MKRFNIILFIILVGLALIASSISYYWHNSKEISPQDYETIIEELERYPSLKPGVRECLSDNKISVGEYLNFLKKIQIYTQNKEKNLYKDSLQKILK